jgi:DNA repair exonuclease SbcCD ATPase subunit
MPSAKNELKQVQQKYDEVKSRLQAQEDQLKRKDGEIEEQKEQHASVLESQRKELDKAKDDLTKEQSQKRDLAEQKVKLVKDLENSKSEVKRKQDQLASIQAEREKAADELFKAKGQIQETEVSTGPLAKENEELVAKLEEKTLLANKLEEDLGAQKDAAKQLTMQRQQEKTTYEEQLKTLNATVAELNTKIEQQSAQFEELTKTTEATKKGLSDQVETLTASCTELEQNLADASDNARKSELEALANAGEASLKSQGKKIDGHIGFSEKLAQGLAQKVLELEEYVYQKSGEAVALGEKNVILQQKLNSSKETMSVYKSDLSSARGVLLGAVAEPGVDQSLYQHVKITELIRLAKSTWLHDDSGAAKTAVRGGSPPASAPTGGEEDTSPGGIDSINQLQKEAKGLRNKNKRLQNTIKELKGELELAMAGLDDVRIMKEKTKELESRQRSEKDQRARSDVATKHANEKVVALSEHIEKLMIHLKHEAAAKAKIHDLQRRTEKEVVLLRERNQALVKKNAARERVIAELKEGSKILEDQLRLMDEKYIELRAKLDWTRASSQKEMKKVQAEANSLRAKWALAVDSGAVSSTPGGDMGGRGKQMHSQSMNTLKPLPSGKARTGMPAIRSSNQAADSTPWSESGLQSMGK